MPEALLTNVQKQQFMQRAIELTQRGEPHGDQKQVFYGLLRDLAIQTRHSGR